MAAGHILRMTQRRPFVQLKLAVSRDGLIARGTVPRAGSRDRRRVPSDTCCARAPMPSWSVAARSRTTTPT